MILCYILWNLGTKVDNQAEQLTIYSESMQTEESGDVEFEDWDEDAEVQARIWFQFIRKIEVFDIIETDGGSILEIESTYGGKKEIDIEQSWRQSLQSDL